MSTLQASIMDEGISNIWELRFAEKPLQLQTLLRFATEEIAAYKEVELTTGADAGVIALAWPCLVDAMCQESYYLSMDELLCVCEVIGRKVVICIQEEDRFSCEGWTKLEAVQNPYVWTKLAADAKSRRGHFERLRFDYVLAEAAEAAAAEERQRREREAEEEQKRRAEREKEERRQREEKRRAAEQEAKRREDAQRIEGESKKEAEVSSGKRRREEGEKEEEVQKRRSQSSSTDMKPPDVGATGEKKKEELDPEEEAKRERREAEWLSMFDVRVKEKRERKHVHDLWREVAAELARGHLRKHVTMPFATDATTEFWIDQVKSGGRLPPVSCAFVGCSWCGGSVFSDSDLQDDPEHPWDQQLRAHILSEHAAVIQSTSDAVFKGAGTSTHIWDTYKLALSCKEQSSIPIVGASVDRRMFEVLQATYNDRTIRVLMCFCCPTKKVDTGRIRSKIEFCSVAWFLSAGADAIMKNCSMARYSARFRMSGTPLAQRESDTNPLGVVGPDFSDWQLRFAPDTIEEYLKLQGEAITSVDAVKYRDLVREILLCNPEDHFCEHGCVEKKWLCLRCRIPICVDCRLCLQRNVAIPAGLMNDNWYGYIEPWIFEQKVTWMEKLVSSPYWTGMTLFAISRHGNRPSARHKMNDVLYQHDARIFSKARSSVHRWIGQLSWNR